MNAGEFTELLNKAISRGIKEGVQDGKMDFSQMVGALEMQKHGVMNLVQQIAIEQQRAQLKAQQPLIVPARDIRPPGM